MVDEIESYRDKANLASAGALHVAELPALGIERAAVAKEAALIYEQSFPSFERIDAQMIFETPEAGRRVLLAQSDERIEGFVSLRAIPNHDAYLLEYLAVAPVSRSGGVGTLLVRQASLLAREGGANQLFMELEDPEGQASSHDSVRRVKFYEGLDCEKVPWLTNYVVPDFNRASRAIPMLLYCQELRDPAVQYEPKGMLAAMYETAYGESGADFLPGMLDQVVTAPG